MRFYLLSFRDLQVLVRTAFPTAIFQEKYFPFIQNIFIISEIIIIIQIYIIVLN